MSALINAQPTTPNDVQPVSASGLPLPSGASTEAKQDAGNASLASIDSKLANPLPVSGPLTDSQLRASAVPVSGPLTDSQLRASPVPISGTVTANAGAQTASSAALSNVNASTSSVQLLAANANRLGAVFFNDTGKVAFLKFGSAASSTSYTFQMAAKSSLILNSNPIYTGLIHAIWAGSDPGAMRITELSA